MELFHALPATKRIHITPPAPAAAAVVGPGALNGKTTETGDRSTPLKYTRRNGYEGNWTLDFLLLLFLLPLRNGLRSFSANRLQVGLVRARARVCASIRKRSSDLDKARQMMEQKCRWHGETQNRKPGRNGIVELRIKRKKSDNSGTLDENKSVLSFVVVDVVIGSFILLAAEECL